MRSAFRIFFVSSMIAALAMSWMARADVKSSSALNANIIHIEITENQVQFISANIGLPQAACVLGKNQVSVEAMSSSNDRNEEAKYVIQTKDLTAVANQAVEFVNSNRKEIEEKQLLVQSGSDLNVFALNLSEARHHLTQGQSQLEQLLNSLRQACLLTKSN